MTRWLIVLVSLTGVAIAKPKRHAHADNMPRGWSWPPNREMEAQAKACEAKLDELGVSWKSAKREGHIVDAVTIPEGALGGIQYIAEYKSNIPVMDCQLALALAEIAPRLWDAGVREVHVGSTYRWSNIRVDGKTKNILSRHALGLAMDVVSFVDADGREAVVAKDYKKGDELLLDIEHAVNDSGIFRTVLTPKNDPKSHHDHFHLEANPDYGDPDDKPRS
ncbi:MAG: extensin family protein [Kofleriaceae bacterium]